MKPELETWKKLGGDPVKADAPAGEAAKYEPVYEALQAEIQKLDGLSREPIEWKEVLDLSRSILKDKSKDLLVASYLAVALFELNRYEGLQNGLACMEEMMTRHWAGMFPEMKRMRARANALQWFAEKAGAAAARKTPDNGDKEPLLSSLNLVNSLEKLFAEKMGADSPGMGDLRRTLEIYQKELDSTEQKRGKENLEEKPAAETRAAASPAATPSPGANIPVEIKSVEDIKPALREARSMVFRAGSLAQASDPLLSWPYRAARAVAWMEMDNLPPEEGGRTRISPPSTEIARLLASMEERGAWADQLKLAETRFKETPFWLDLNRFSVKAMAGLGAGYRSGADAIKAELAKLATRLPRLIELQFSDGTPFADSKTQSWIESEVLGGEAKSEAIGSSPALLPGIGDEELEEVKSKAKGLINEGKLKEGIGLFHKALSETPSQKSKFLITLEMSRACLESNQIRLAVSYLEKLDHEIRRFSLEEWEPGLSGQTLQTYWFSLGKQFQEIKPPSPEIAQQIEEVYKRICRLDPMAAIDLDQKKKGGWFNRS